MNITTCNSDQINIKELADFMAKVRSAEIEARGFTLAELENKLRDEWRFMAYILARSGRELIGYALMYQIPDSDLIEINPGALLGHHPVIASGFDEAIVGQAMIKAAQKSVVDNGYKSLYIDIPWNPSAPQDTYLQYRQRYGDLGFEVIQQVLQMRSTLPIPGPERSMPSDIQLSQIQTVDEDALFRCHHQAYLAGDAQYYFQMDEAERHDDFKRIYAPKIRENQASFVLTQEGNILGYCLLFAEGDFSELMSLAVHPDFRRQGFGTLLMNACLHRAGESGLKTMHLIVDVKNEAAARLYRRCGFKETGGNMTFKWAA